MNDKTPELCECGHKKNDHARGGGECITSCPCMEFARVAPDTDLKDALPLRYELEEAAEKFVEAHLHDKENYTCAELMAAFAHTVANERLGWVPVSERLPDAPQTGPQAKCLVTVLCPDGSLEVLPSGYWNDAGWALEARWKAEETSGFQIVAWMPRPEPYKQGETE